MVGAVEKELKAWAPMAQIEESSHISAHTSLQAVNPASENLSDRLREFRKWLTDDAGAYIHPAVAIINGDVNDGTKNAP